MYRLIPSSADFWNFAHIMDRTTAAKAAVSLLLICSLTISLRSTAVEDGSNLRKDHLLTRQQVEGHKQQQQQMAEPPATAIIDTPPSTIIDAAKTLFSLPNSRLALLRAAASNYLIKLKTILLFQHDQDDFSAAPTLGFRTENDQVEPRADGAGEKVKEAIARSIHKSKEAVEDTAISAAKLAGDAMEKTAKKVKKTLSDASEEAEL